MLRWIIIFLVSISTTEVDAQSLLSIINKCPHVKGAVTSTALNITNYEDVTIKSSIERNFDRKGRLITHKRLDSRGEIIEKTDYFYSKNKLIKESYYLLDQLQYSLFYQYRKTIPLRVIKVDTESQILQLGDILLDSLRRPIILDIYDLSRNKLNSQEAEYGEYGENVIIYYLDNKRKGYSYEYRLCESYVDLFSVNENQFKDESTKILNFTVKDKKATIVKAVEKGIQEAIYIQEIDFDEEGNWVNSKHFRLKKRKEKKILVQEVNRLITYRE